MYLNPTDKHWIIDVEADDLAATVVWVVCVENAITKEKKALIGYDEIREWFRARIAEGCRFVGHNIIKFDAPVLNRLVGCGIPLSRLVDTFLLSMLYSPAFARPKGLPKRKNAHSLAAWGLRVDVPKKEWTDFSQLSDGMIDYCFRDVALTKIVFLKLTERMRQIGFTDRGCKIEHKAWHIIKKQKDNGFYIDEEKAYLLFCELRNFEKELAKDIHKKFPPTLELLKTLKNPYKKNGEPSAKLLEVQGVYPKVVIRDDEFDVYNWKEFSIGSPDQRVQKLLELGWKPREFTKKTDKGGGGNPKATDKGDLVPSLKEFVERSGIEEVKLIAEWIAVNGRANMIGNWLDVRNKETGCVHGNLWVASTHRYRHDKPNTANIPRVRTKKLADKTEVPLFGREGLWTYEARDCWTTRDRDRRRLVGVDAKGIQLRILAHYLNDPEFTEAILSEDPHEANQKRMGLPSRSLTKTITYATLMGAGDGRIASEARVSLKEAKEAKAKFFATVPGLPKLIERLTNELSRTGRITLCDGSRLLVPSPHMVIPYLLQGDESKIMRQAAIYVDATVRKEKLDVLKVGDIHDEWQSDVLQEHIERYIATCREAFARSGRSFNYNLPIECDAKVGYTWAETH